MRCPKCGYISFDHLEECLKCKKNIMAATSNLQGSVYKVAAPTFLQIQRNNHEDSDELVDLFADDVDADEGEFVDEDLEILVESSDEVSAGEDSTLTIEDDDDVMIDFDDTEIAIEADAEEEEEGIEIDLSQFEDKSDPELGFTDDDRSEKLEETLGIEIPEELADISDLAPPGLEPDMTLEQDDQSEEPEPEPEEPALNLDDLDFDLGMGGLDVEDTPVSSTEKVLSLDEIDFDDTLSGIKPTDLDGRPKGGGVSMDEDLDFELDLGGLSIHKDE